MSLNERPPDRRPVLVVEDDDLLREVLTLQIEQAGYLSIQATNVDAAVALLETHSPLAVVTDLHLRSKGNGFDLAYLARDIDPLVAILVLTGDSEASSDGLPSGTEVLIKPVRAKELIAAVERVIGVRSG